MKKKVIIWSAVGATVLMLVAVLTVVLLTRPTPQELDYGYAGEVSESEKALRQRLIDNAETWLGTVQGSPEHHQIIDLYNAQEKLPVGYPVTYEDDWCATFVTTVALQSGLTDIIPPECGCQRQIALFEEMGCWEEKDTYVPLPGDVIYYAWEEISFGDCTGWADHVGIVVGTAGNYIKVIEGNNQGVVNYRYVHKHDGTVRGFGLPDYSGQCE